LAGLSVAPGRALVISEESPLDWRPRFEQLSIRDHVHLLCRPFPAQPTMDQWLALIQTAVAVHDRQGLDLVVIDSLAQFLPAHSENSSGALLECLTPLQRLTASGLSVLLVHHPHKGKTVAGQAARGSGALPSFVDIIIEMGYHTGPDDLDRRRRLVAFSRHEQTPRHLLIELQAGGNDYVVLQTGLEAALGESWQAVLSVLMSAVIKMTRQEILDQLPAGHDRPEATTLWRWLSRALAQGQIRQDGTGRPNDPFRYWLSARQEMMRPDGDDPEELQAWNDRYMEEVLRNMPTPAVSRSAVQASRSALPVAPAEAPPVPQEPVPLPEKDQVLAALAPAAPETPTLKAAEPGTPAPRDASVRLPYPYNVINPADVPEEIWKKAEAAARKG
jgi:AAA domain-containing protein